MDYRMKGDLIPDSDHVARHCRASHYNQETGEISAAEFILRKTIGETELSVNWLEYLRLPDRAAELAEIRRVYMSKFKRVAAGAQIAILNVGRTRGYVLNAALDSRDLKFVHDPIDNSGVAPDPSHSGIHNCEPDNMMIAELIIQAIVDLHPARQP